MSQPREATVLIREGEQALRDKDLDKAQRLFSGALKLDITNADLQFLNGLAYHLIGLSKDRSKLELAEQGLLLALKFDPSHLAARYQLGLLYMDQRRYALAQGHLAAVALHRPEDAALLYNLAASSYYSHDPQMAEAALNQLAKVAPTSAVDPDVLWAQADPNRDDPGNRRPRPGPGPELGPGRLPRPSAEGIPVLRPGRRQLFRHQRRQDDPSGHRGRGRLGLRPELAGKRRRGGQPVP